MIINPLPRVLVRSSANIVKYWFIVPCHYERQQRSYTYNLSPSTKRRRWLDENVTTSRADNRDARKRQVCDDRCLV